MTTQQTIHLATASSSKGATSKKYSLWRSAIDRGWRRVRDRGSNTLSHAECSAEGARALTGQHKGPWSIGYLAGNRPAYSFASAKLLVARAPFSGRTPCQCVNVRARPTA